MARAKGATGWRDLAGTVITRGAGPTDPSWTQIGSSVFYAFSFDVNDIFWIAYNIPHDYIPGSPVHAHIQWFPGGTDVNPVKWQFDFMYANGHNQQAFQPLAPMTLTAVDTPPGVAYQHMISHTPGSPHSNFEPNGILYAAVTRIANGATDNTDDIFLGLVSLEYQSSDRGSPNHEPPFWNSV